MPCAGHFYPNEFHCWTFSNTNEAAVELLPPGCPAEYVRLSKVFKLILTKRRYRY